MSEAIHPPLIAIYGCTGVGKSAYAIRAAQSFNGEIVNADSRYLYRGLTIGVSKPTLEEQQTVRHHLIDLFDPHEHSSISVIQSMAYSAINEIHESGKVPILVGGTPLYMNAIVEGWQIPEVAADWEFRAMMEQRLASEGLAILASELELIDPIAVHRSGRNPRRVIRALEIHHVTGRPMSSLESKQPPPYRTLALALDLDRNELHQRLDRRVDTMIESGLVEEVRSLIAGGLTGEEPAFSAIGYRQLLPYLAGNATLAVAIEQIKRDTHRYVRHQSTWMRRKKDLVWIDTSEPEWPGIAEKYIRDHIFEPGRSKP